MLQARTFASYVPATSMDVLDFGCGGGWLLRSLKSKGRRVGVEPNPAAREQCHENGVEVHASIDSIDGQFDRVLSHHCLEHVLRPVECLRDLRGKIKPDGLLILVVPLDDWRAQKAARAGDKDNHLQTWTPRLLGNSLIEAGFTPQRVEVLTHAWPPRAFRLLAMLGLVYGDRDHKNNLLARLRWRVFDMAAYVTAVVLRRRQIVAVAALRG